MAWYLFNWKDGEIIREFVTSSDRILLDSRGDDTISATVPWDTLTATEKRNFRSDFSGVKRGIAYSEVSAVTGTERIVAAGQLTNSASLRDGALQLEAHSFKEYLTGLAYETKTSITDSEEKFTFKGTARDWLKKLLDNVSDRTHTPTLGAITGGDPGSSKTWSIVLADLEPISDLMDQVADLEIGCETRFEAKKVGSKIVFNLRLPVSEKRLLNAEKIREVDLDDESTAKVISLVPSNDWSDTFTGLWNQIDRDPGKDGNLIDLKKNTISVWGDLPESNTYENFANMLTDEERAEQVQARLKANKHPLETWEVKLFDETIGADNTFVHPLTWDGHDQEALGCTYVITGGTVTDTEALSERMRCLGVQFSSHSSEVTIQLADERDIYPKMPRRPFEKKKKKLPKKDKKKKPEKKDKPPNLPPFPDPDWPWGTENDDFKDGPGGGTTDPIYGFKLGAPTLFDLNVQGVNLPPESNITDLNNFAHCQDNLGSGYYQAYFTSPTLGGNGAQKHGNINRGAKGLEFYHIVESFTFQPGVTRYRLRSLGPTEGPIELAITSGKFSEGTIENLVLRGKIKFTKDVVENLIFSSTYFGLRYPDRIFDFAANRVVIAINGISVHKNRIAVVLKVMLSNDGTGLNGPAKLILTRFLNINKGEKYDSINTDSWSISGSIDQKNYVQGLSPQGAEPESFNQPNWGNHPYGKGYAYSRAGAWIYTVSSDQHRLADISPTPEIKEENNNPENWVIAGAYIPNGTYVLDSKNIKFPVVKIGEKYFAQSNITGAVSAGTVNDYRPRNGRTNQTSLFTIAPDGIGVSLYSTAYPIDTIAGFEEPLQFVKYTSGSSGSIQTVLKGQMYTDGFGMIGDWEPLTKTYTGDYVSYNNTTVITSDTMLTIMGCPVKIGFKQWGLVSGGTGRDAIEIAYLNRLYVATGAAGDEFIRKDFGKHDTLQEGEETPLPLTATTTYPAGELIPTLSYYRRGLGNSSTLSTQKVPWSETFSGYDTCDVFYYKGYIYVMNKSVAGNSSFSTDIRKGASFKVTAVKSPQFEDKRHHTGEPINTGYSVTVPQLPPVTPPTT